MLPELKAQQLLADKAYGAQARVLDLLQTRGTQAVIPPKANRLTPRAYDAERYKDRHLSENFFLKLKHFCAITTRYDKTKRDFFAAILLA